MYTPKKLFTIIKLNTLMITLYFAFRTALFLNFGLHANATITVLMTIVCGGIAYYLSKDIWATRGMLFMSLILMLFVTDIVILMAMCLFGQFPNRFITMLWGAGGIGVIATLIFLLYGLINEKNVKKNVLCISSSKIKTPCKYAVLSDLHFGTIQPEHILADTTEKINKEGYDGVLLVGDIAEEKTSHESLLRLFQALGKLNTKGGTFFVHGNHDRQEKLHGAGRTYTDEEFDTLMAAAGIKCIDDSITDLSETLQLIGRNDYSVADRKGTTELLAASDQSKLRILMEHQPTEYGEVAEDGVEVILSAHYHGAQNWPNNIIYRLAGMQYNGRYAIGNATLYVNAGLTGSKYKVRTHAHCEYLCLEIVPASDRL